MVHVLEKRHDALGALDAACPDNFAPTDVEASPIPSPLVDLPDYKAVGIREVWHDEEAARAKLTVVAVPVKRSSVSRPTVPGTSDVLSSNVMRAVLTFAGMPGPKHAEPMESLGMAMFSASMKSSPEASPSI